MVPVHNSTGSSTYLVTVGFGTPKRDYALIFDTGSDPTWMQCKTCRKCYKQDHQMFDPSQSTSYHNGSCKSNNSNTYDQEYGDGSYSNGILGCDTLTLDSDVITNFEFGCGQENSGEFDADVAGILGLGRGKLSLISQTASKFGKSFGYCLPTPQNPNSGYLLFGKHAKSLSSSLKFTPLLQNPADNLSFYFVKLVGITVGTKRLNVSPWLFSSPGTIVDSGTVITRLPQPVYLALRSAFRKSMSKYPLAPPVDLLLDTCYDLSQYQKVTYPSILFHFGGGTDVSLDQSGIMSGNKSSFCMAFAMTSDFTIIGSTQQQALNVFYDLKGGKIGFGTKGCHN
ncbi:Aspartyl protease family protein [Camellia lanceoleosa]|uniref:Aspartyl protease family protein n=1 Tax=Camellia lanceoleosa TaxID=1840588 RepID=A0ACC0FNC8_9ERIC|nr:Aspartyl protease family protein [Camellia lanceoleosa]